MIINIKEGLCTSMMSLGSMNQVIIECKYLLPCHNGKFIIKRGMEWKLLHQVCTWPRRTWQWRISSQLLYPRYLNKLKLCNYFFYLFCTTKIEKSHSHQFLNCQFIGTVAKSNLNTFRENYAEHIFYAVRFSPNKNSPKLS